MRIAEVMTRDVQVVSPSESIERAARIMGELDLGFLPVGEEGRLVGTITDRDIAVRGVGQGMRCDSPIREVMSPDVKYCFDDQELDEVSANMGDIQVRRLPVVSRDKRLVGVVSLGDIAKELAPEAGLALGDVTRDSEQHNQTA